MAYKVIWSPESVSDLDEIATYIAKDSLINAIKVVDKFYDLIGGYGKFPNASTVVPELASEVYRQKYVYDWRVIYKVDADAKVVSIIAILHGKRLFNAIQGRFLV